MAKARKKQERDQRDDLLDKIDFKGLTCYTIKLFGLFRQYGGKGVKVL
jgi:hypothetical protein